MAHSERVKNEIVPHMSPLKNKAQQYQNGLRCLDRILKKVSVSQLYERDNLYKKMFAIKINICLYYTLF